jgi:uncharacterized protein (TIGR03435 family)
MRRAAVFFAFASVAAFGQAPPAPEFEVASVRASNADTGLIENRVPSLNAEPGRNLTFNNISIRDLIMLAYGVGARQITGPDVILNRFDIVAKIPSDATKEQVPLMLRTLLAQRFKLTLHRDQKTMQVYALEVAKGGPKLNESPAGEAGLPGCARSFAQTPGATLAAVCQRMSSAELAQQIQALAPGYFTDGPIVDMTGLKGIYNFKLEWITRVEVNAGSDGPTIFDAVQKQLGLKLEGRKQAMETIVIDHCEKIPTEN